MSKQNHGNKQQAKSAEVEKVEAVERKREIKEHMKCPSCFGERGGVGRRGWWRRINGTLVKRQYICKVCGFDWTVEERTHSVIESIEYNDIIVQHRDIDMETR
jgi:transposase-like protein